MTPTTLLTNATLAYTPFLHPINALHDHWLWCLPPLVIAIAVVYKTLKLEPLEHLVSESAQLAAYILFLMAVAAAGLWALISVV
ncbi:MAG: hypothetical protein ACYTGQ_16100 [Planctomycetota bacterium]|jgi:hypothetical protein